MRPIVKICGITSMEDARICTGAGADLLGFIFHKASPRYIRPDAAATLICALPPEVTPVGVFVNTSRQDITSIVGETGIRILQFSGDESPADCSGYDLPCWKAFRIRNDAATLHVAEYPVDAVLLDGAMDGQYGGTGTPPDFRIARLLSGRYKLIVAGGISPANVTSVLAATHPYGIDVNSGVEAFPGKKAADKVNELFRQIALSAGTLSEETRC
jgi:phosphoribosylanthranilate isomerase